MPSVENGDSDIESGATVDAVAVGVVSVPVPVDVPPVCVAEKSTSCAEFIVRVYR